MGSIYPGPARVEALGALAWAAADAAGAIFAESRVSLAALGVLFVLCLGLARSGGVGAVPGPPPPPPAGRRQSLAEALAARCAPVCNHGMGVGFSIRVESHQNPEP